MAIDELREETKKDAIFLQLDLTDLKAVKVAVEEFNKFVIYVPLVSFFFPSTHSL